MRDRSAGIALAVDGIIVALVLRWTPMTTTRWIALLTLVLAGCGGREDRNDCTAGLAVRPPLPYDECERAEARAACEAMPDHHFALVSGTQGFEENWICALACDALTGQPCSGSEACVEAEALSGATVHVCFRDGPP